MITIIITTVKQIYISHDSLEHSDPRTGCWLSHRTRVGSAYKMTLVTTHEFTRSWTASACQAMRRTVLQIDLCACWVSTNAGVCCLLEQVACGVLPIKKGVSKRSTRVRKKVEICNDKSTKAFKVDLIGLRELITYLDSTPWCVSEGIQQLSSCWGAWGPIGQKVEI